MYEGRAVRTWNMEDVVSVQKGSLARSSRLGEVLLQQTVIVRIDSVITSNVERSCCCSLVAYFGVIRRDILICLHNLNCLFFLWLFNHSNNGNNSYYHDLNIIIIIPVLFRWLCGKQTSLLHQDRRWQDKSHPHLPFEIFASTCCTRWKSGSPALIYHHLMIAGCLSPSCVPRASLIMTSWGNYIYSLSNYFQLTSNLDWMLVAL